MNNKRVRATLTEHGIKQPLPDRTITDARWIAEHGDWWVLIDGTWYWWDRNASAWKSSQHGPS